MTTTLRAGSAHEFLALVPHLAGFAPERSLLCVAFEGGRSVGVLRHDLPRRGRDRAALVAVVVATLCRMPGVDGVLPVVYTDDRFGARRAAPERRLVELLVDRADEAGFVVRDALCVAADAWGSYFEPGLPATGHPLELIERCAATEAVPEADRPVGGVASAGSIPEPDPDRARAIARELDALTTAAPGAGEFARLGESVDPVELVERLLEHGRVPEHVAAWFLHLASRPPFRDGMMLQFAFGPVVGAAAHDDAGELGTRAEACGVTVDELVRRELEDGRFDQVQEMLAGLIVGCTTLRPERPRVERAAEVMLRLIADAPDRYRVGPLCIAAWLNWALGRGSAAGALLDRALGLEPEHTMARLLERHLGSGALPDWAFLRPDRRGVA